MWITQAESLKNMEASLGLVLQSIGKYGIFADSSQLALQLSSLASHSTSVDVTPPSQPVVAHMYSAVNAIATPLYLPDQPLLNQCQGATMLHVPTSINQYEGATVLDVPTRCQINPHGNTAEIAPPNLLLPLHRPADSLNP